MVPKHCSTRNRCLLINLLKRFSDWRRGRPLAAPLPPCRLVHDAITIGAERNSRIICIGFLFVAVFDRVDIFVRASRTLNKACLNDCRFSLLQLQPLAASAHGPQADDKLALTQHQKHPLQPARCETYNGSFRPARAHADQDHKTP